MKISSYLWAFSYKGLCFLLKTVCRKDTEEDVRINRENHKSSRIRRTAATADSSANGLIHPVASFNLLSKSGRSLTDIFNARSMASEFFSTLKLVAAFIFLSSDLEAARQVYQFVNDRPCIS